MDSISLKLMTRELYHEMFKEWKTDAIIFSDNAVFEEFSYDKARVDRDFDSKQEKTRVVLAVMLDDKPIGELELKHIKEETKECSLSIHMINDNYKGKGYGTEAEKLGIKYAFEELKLEKVTADILHKNTRSQRVVEKIGFKCVSEDAEERHYEINREDYIRIYKKC